MTKYDPMGLGGTKKAIPLTTKHPCVQCGKRLVVDLRKLRPGRALRCVCGAEYIWEQDIEDNYYPREVVTPAYYKEKGGRV